MAFNDDANWTVTRVDTPNYVGRSGAGLTTLPATWTLNTGIQSPRDVKAFNDEEAGQASSAVSNPSFHWNSPLTQNRGFRLSADARLGINGGYSANGGVSLLYVATSSFTLQFGIDIKHWLPDMPPNPTVYSYETVPYASPAQTFVAGWTFDSYYRIGIKKLNGSYSWWIRTTGTPASSGRGVDSQMTCVATALGPQIFPVPSYVTCFTSSAETIANANFGSLSNIYLEELTENLKVVSSPKGMIEPPPFDPDSNPFVPIDLQTATPAQIAEAETQAYHRYKSVRAAVGTYNNLQLNP